MKSFTYLLLVSLFFLGSNLIAQNKSDSTLKTIQKRFQVIEDQYKINNTDILCLKDSLESFKHKIEKFKTRMNDNINESKITSKYLSSTLGVFTTIILIIFAIAIYFAGYLIPKKQLNSIESRITSIENDLNEKINENKEYFNRNIDSTKSSLEKLISSSSDSSLKLFEEYKKQFDTNLEKLNKELLGNISESVDQLENLKIQLEFTELQVRKSMYFICLDSKAFIAACSWALRVAGYYYKIKHLDPNSVDIKAFLDFGIHHIENDITKDDLKKEKIEDYKNIINLVKNHKDDDVLKKIKKFENLLYTKYYS